MDRVKIPSGSVQKLETVFDDLQLLAYQNLKKRFDSVISEYGIVNSVINGEQDPSDNSLMVSITNRNSSSFTIQPGVAIFKTGDILILENAITEQLSNIYSGTIASNSFYQINIKYKEIGTDPIVSMNGFYFDKTGLTPYSQRFSRWSDSYELVAYLRTSGNSILVPDDEIPLAIIKTSSVSSITIGEEFDYTDDSSTVSSNQTVIDLRKNYSLKLKHITLDDSYLVLKNRDSVGINKINGSLEAINLLASSIMVSGISTFNNLNSNSLTINNTSSAYILLNSANTYSTSLIFRDTSDYRGYIQFNLNDEFGIGFNNPIESDSSSYIHTGRKFVIKKTGEIGNFDSPLKELHLKNISLTDSVSLRMEYDNGLSSLGFDFGVESSKGYIKPITSDNVFEFLNLSNNYSLRINNSTRTAQAYNFTVDNLTTLNSVNISSGYISSISGLTSTFNTSIISNLIATELTVTDASNINLPGTSSTEFRVGVGSLEYPSGRLVKLEDPDVETPSNFRIYDVYPTSDMRESQSLVWLKWNWDGLNGVKQNNNEVVLNYNTTTGEILDLTKSNAIIRKFYFTSSGNTYDISDYDSNTRTITLASNYTSSDVISDTYPAKIIDKYAKAYTIRAIEVDVDTNGLTDRSVIHTLDNEDLVRNPQQIIKLELNKKWSLSIKSFNKSYSSPFVTMLASSYDPDHVGGGQNSVGYSSPYLNILPDIDGACDPGTLTLSGTPFGFRLEIEGWEGPTRETSAHEFEIGYTTLSGITWENSAFSTTRKTGTTFLRTTNRTLNISTNDSGIWTVGVRPIQNNQVVGIPVLSIVTSGGGGIAPNDSIVVGPFDFRVIVTSGIFVSEDTDNTYIISGHNSEVWGEDSLSGSIITYGSYESPILKNALRGDLGGTIGSGTDLIYAFVKANTTISDYTVNLPLASSISNRLYIVKSDELTNGVVYINAAGSDTIDGQTSITINTPLTSIIMHSDGSNYWILN